MGGETFGQWLTQRMSDVGLPRPADVNRVTGISASLVGRWMRDEALPGMTNIRRLAPALRTSTEVIAARAGHLIENGTQELPGQALPLLHELSQLLDPDGPVPDDERASLTALIDNAIRPYRRHLRGRDAG